MEGAERLSAEAELQQALEAMEGAEDTLAIARRTARGISRGEEEALRSAAALLPPAEAGGEVGLALAAMRGAERLMDARAHAAWEGAHQLA